MNLTNQFNHCLLIEHRANSPMELVAAEAIEPACRVRWSDSPGHVVVAGDEPCLGVSVSRARSLGEAIWIHDIRTPGTLAFKAAGAIAVGDSFSSAASGRVQSGSSGSEVYGLALTAAPHADIQIEGIAHK